MNCREKYRNLFAGNEIYLNFSHSFRRFVWRAFFFPTNCYFVTLAIKSALMCNRFLFCLIIYSKNIETVFQKWPQNLRIELWTSTILDAVNTFVKISQLWVQIIVIGHQYNILQWQWWTLLTLIDIAYLLYIFMLVISCPVISVRIQAYRNQKYHNLCYCNSCKFDKISNKLLQQSNSYRMTLPIFVVCSKNKHEFIRISTIWSATFSMNTANEILYRED